MRSRKNIIMATIKTTNLTVTFFAKKKGTITALNNVNAVFKNGEFNVILGASGCGKTTLLRTIAGLQEYEGEILYDGVDADELSFKERNISYVTQNYSLYSHLNIFDNIAFPLKTIGASREEIIPRVMELAKQLNIEICLNRKPRQLSGGQQQRASLARALIKKPSVCFLDEPLSNIDVQQRENVRVLMKKTLKLNGCTVVYVTHDFSEAMALADKIFIMNEGKIVQTGTPIEVFNSNDAIVQALKGSCLYDGTILPR